MGTFKKRLVFVLTLLVALSGVPLPSALAAVSDYVTVTKSVNPTSITTEEEAEVTLKIQGTPPVNVIEPNDVILIIDKSGSMAPGNNNGEDKMGAAKDAAKGFIDLMDLTKHQVGVVDFSSASMMGTFPLTSDGAAAKQYIDTITANGSTATGDAIEKAINELSNHRPEARPVIVIMTDGDATEPKNNPYEYAKQWAQTAKDAGITFYTIALLKSTDNPNTSGPNLLLKEMATTSSHHHFVLGSTGLKEIYAAIVKEIGMASAYDVEIKDIVSPEFEIVPGSYDNNIPKPTVNGNTLTWKFTELKNNALSFTYKIRAKDPNKKGTFPVSSTASSIAYKDYAGASRTKAIPSVNLEVKFPAPTITSIENSFGHPNGGESVKITGTRFQPGATVKFGSVSATNVNVVSATEITAVTPPNVQGTYVVTVTNPDSQKATTNYQYKADPIVTSIEPNHGTLAGGTLVMFKGNYFMKDVSVSFGKSTAPMNTYSSATYFKVNAPVATEPGPVDVVVTNPDGTTVTIPGGYTYDAPVIEKLEVASISPNTGEFAGGELIYLDGKKFAQGVKVYFGEKESPSITYVSNIRIKAVAPAATAAGKVDITVINPDGESVTVKEGYTYKAPPVLPTPQITKITPDNGLLPGGEIVTIEGANFVNGLKVYLGTNEAQVRTFFSSSKFTVIAPVAIAEGPVDVKVVNPDKQEAVKAGGYTYLASPPPLQPSITSLSPNTGLTDGGLLVYIDGNNFEQGLKVYFGSKEATVVTYNSNTRIKISTPAVGAEGAVDVKIVNPSGAETVKQSGFTYTAPAPAPAPTITNISPDNSLLAGGVLVYIDGANFVQGVKVYFGSVEAPVVTFNSSTRFKVTAPAAVTEGPVDVKIVNPDGQEVIKSAGFTYMTPPAEPVEITNISPNKGLTKGGELITLDGVNFKNGATVYFGSTPVALDTYYSSTRVKVKAPASSALGPVDVTLTNTDGQTFTVPQGYTYEETKPEVTNVSPNHGPMAGGTLVYIDGKNFDPNMTAVINGKSIPVSYNSATRIKITTPGSAVSGEVPLVFTLPSGASFTTSFTYDAPPPTPAPIITGISPTSGPIKGGTLVYVDGKNFVNGVKGYFNGVEAKLITFNSSVRVKYESPATASPGVVEFKLVNPDGQESNTVSFEYK
ncbi:IPT/TIG domain-containing protein [Brevibacillus choshinensis]|uniref:IPT/TIG domain-containing protein n=1 Tax=Brevibacillus choshinensis TaxID=54911 RepID=UPI002E1D9354|nr:IPT/TIG domain-containing protein [Brevibacillus choshinensis]